MARARIEINIDEVRRLASEGYSEGGIAEALGISADTLQRRKRDSADFAAAIKRGQATANSNVSNALFKQAKKGNVAAIIWWEKTRAGMSDRAQVDVYHHARQEIEQLAMERGVSIDDALAQFERLVGART